MEDYEKLYRLGNGGQGKILKVKHKKTGALHACKMVLCRNNHEMNFALNEIKVLMSLKHAHIVTYRDFFVHKDRYDDLYVCLVMQLCEHGDLSEKIRDAKRKHSQFNHPRIVKWMSQICMALQHMHQLGLIHRDVKPSNVFFTAQDDVKIGDFGLSTSVNASGRRTVVGSPFYWAPELMLHQKYDAKVDMWGCGLVLMELATLEERTMNNEVLNNPRILAEVESQIVQNGFSPVLATLCRRLLDRRPQHRPTASEVLAWLATDATHPTTTSENCGNENPRFHSAPSLPITTTAEVVPILCDLCQERPARFQCEECDNDQLCGLCDAQQHRAQIRSHHQRVLIIHHQDSKKPSEHGLCDAPLVVVCSVCTNAPATVQCVDCCDAFCGVCDAMRHKNPKRQAHSRQPQCCPPPPYQRRNSAPNPITTTAPTTGMAATIRNFGHLPPAPLVSTPTAATNTNACQQPPTSRTPTHSPPLLQGCCANKLRVSTSNHPTTSPPTDSPSSSPTPTSACRIPDDEMEPQRPILQPPAPCPPEAHQPKPPAVRPPSGRGPMAVAPLGPQASAAASRSVFGGGTGGVVTSCPSPVAAMQLQPPRPAVSGAEVRYRNNQQNIETAATAAAAAAAVAPVGVPPSPVIGIESASGGGGGAMMQSDNVEAVCSSTTPASFESDETSEGSSSQSSESRVSSGLLFDTASLEQLNAAAGAAATQSHPGTAVVAQQQQKLQAMSFLPPASTARPSGLEEDGDHWPRGSIGTQRPHTAAPVLGTAPTVSSSCAEGSTKNGPAPLTARAAAATDQNRLPLQILQQPQHRGQPPPPSKGFQPTVDTVSNAFPVLADKKQLLAASERGTAIAAAAATTARRHHQPPSSLRRTLRVPDDYETIAEALFCASDGDKIYVLGGSYSEPLCIDKEVTIVGKNGATVVVDAGGSGGGLPAVSISAANGRIEHLVIQSISGSPSTAGGGDTPAAGWKVSAVDITSGSVVLSECEIVSQSGACVTIHGAEADPILDQCAIHGGKQAGVYIFDHARATITECDVYDNEYAGVLLKRGASPNVSNCKIRDGKGTGIFVCHESNGVISGNEICNNQGSGVVIKGGGNPIFRDNSVFGNKQAGVFCCDRGRGQIERNEIFGNAKAGILIKTNGNPSVKSNLVHGGKEAGVYVFDSGEGKLEDNDIYENENAGVLVTTGGRPHFVHNHIHHNKYEGVWVCKGGGGMFIRNDLRHNCGAVDVTEDCTARVQLVDNVLE